MQAPVDKDHHHKFPHHPEQMARGMYITTVSRFIETYPPELQAQIKAKIPADVRTALTNIRPGDWYPLHFASQQVRAIFELYPNRDDAEREIQRCGAYIGEQATNSFLRLLMKMLTLKMMVSKWPEFWLKYHNFGRMRVEIPGPGHLVFIIEPGYDYMYLMGQGWIEVACKGLGLKNLVMKNNMVPPSTNIEQIRIDATFTK